MLLSNAKRKIWSNSHCDNGGYKTIDFQGAVLPQEINQVTQQHKSGLSDNSIKYQQRKDPHRKCKFNLARHTLAVCFLFCYCLINNLNEMQFTLHKVNSQNYTTNTTV